MSDVISFGPYAFDADNGTLLREGKAIALGTRGAAVLSALVEANGDAVGKETLIEAAWPGIAIEEGNLTVQIAALRKALGTRPDGLDWISTVPRVGYRLPRSNGLAAEAPALVIPSLV